jgi:hypothetical protein
MSEARCQFLASNLRHLTSALEVYLPIFKYIQWPFNEDNIS